MRQLLDEMYPSALAAALTTAGQEAVTVGQGFVSGPADSAVFAFALKEARIVLTENVGDFVAIAAQHLSTGAHHPGLMIALSQRFSRRPSGYGPLVAAIVAHNHEDLTDQVIYLSATAAEPPQPGRAGP